jgi:hypothetical protein
MPPKNQKKGSKGNASSSRHSSESAAMQLEEQQRRSEEYSAMLAILGMLEAVGEQERAARAEQVGNQFIADAAKQWGCSACTRINEGTDNACASCDKDKQQPFPKKEDNSGLYNHDIWLAIWNSLHQQQANPKESNTCMVSPEENACICPGCENEGVYRLGGRCTECSLLYCPATNILIHLCDCECAAHNEHTIYGAAMQNRKAAREANLPEQVQRGLYWTDSSDDDTFEQQHAGVGVVDGP